MQRSHVHRYQLSKALSLEAYVEVAVRREDAVCWRDESTRYTLEISLCQPSNIDPSIFSQGPTALALEASFDARAREVLVANIEARSLERGQDFARRTFSQLLALTPECEALVLYNILNRKAEAVVDLARSTPDWVVPAEGALLRALYGCGFQQVVGIKRGGSAYRCVRAFHRQGTA